MPPKKNQSKNNQQTAANKEELDKSTEAAEAAMMPSLSSFEEILDVRLKAQMKELNEVVAKYHKSTKDELKSIQTSQEFINEKFDELLISFNQLKEENSQLKMENSQLKINAAEMAQRMSSLEDDQENLNLYSRRDCLEFHGIPEASDENTDDLIKQIGELMAVEISPSDISISHRLPSKRGRIPPIIVKFARRCTRDKLYKSKSHLRNRNLSDLGFNHTSNNLYVNESLTPKARDLYFQVREFKRQNDFKYA